MDYSAARWHPVKPKDLDRLPGFGQAQTALTCLAACHPNGHVRQAAIERLAEGDDDAALSFLLVRLNDWVAPVREASALAVEHFLRPEKAATFLNALAALLHLRACGRANHEPLIALALAMIREATGEEALLDRLRSADRLVRRGALAFLLDREIIALARLVNVCLSSPDPLLRLPAIRRLEVISAEPDFERFMARALADRLSSLRQEALRIYLQRRPGETESICTRFLFDPSGGIRFFCWYHLRETGAPDLAQIYRDALSSHDAKKLSATLCSLAELGERTDAALAAPFSKDPRKTVRAAAVRALGALDAEAYEDRIYRALGDPTLMVAREALWALEKSPGRPAAERLWPLLVEPASRHTRWLAMSALDRAAMWNRLPYLLRASESPDPELRRFGLAHLAAWYPSGYVGYPKLAPEARRELAQLIDRVEPSLPRRLHHITAIVREVLAAQ